LHAANCTLTKSDRSIALELASRVICDFSVIYKEKLFSFLMLTKKMKKKRH